MQKNYEIKTIPFHGDQLVGVLDHRTNDIFSPVRLMCESLGLSNSGQQERIRRHRVLSEGVRMIRMEMVIMAPEQTDAEREMFCLRQDLLPLWLTTINANKVKPELREKLYLYQKEAAHVLARHFLGHSQALPATDKDSKREYLIMRDRNGKHRFILLEDGKPIHMETGTLTVYEEA